MDVYNFSDFQITIGRITIYEFFNDLNDFGEQKFLPLKSLNLNEFAQKKARILFLVDLNKDESLLGISRTFALSDLLNPVFLTFSPRHSVISIGGRR